jgi:hypothetical protein
MVSRAYSSALKMEVACFCETWIDFSGLHNAMLQKITFFISSALTAHDNLKRTWRLIHGLQCSPSIFPLPETIVHSYDYLQHEAVWIWDRNFNKIESINWVWYIFVIKARELMCISLVSILHTFFCIAFLRLFSQTIASIGVGHDMCAIIKIWQQEVMILSHGWV